MNALLVLGVGNLLRADDGLGVLAVQTLLQDPWPTGVTLLDAGTFTQDLSEPLLHTSHLLVLDAIKMGCPCVGLLDALGMCERRSGHSPEMLILGMEPYDIASWHIGLSVPLQAHFNAYLTAARHCIAELICGSET